MQIEWKKGKPEYTGSYFVVPASSVDPNKYENENSMLWEKITVASCYYSVADDKWYTDYRRQFVLEEDEIYVWAEQFFITNEELLIEVGDREEIDI